MGIGVRRTTTHGDVGGVRYAAGFFRVLARSATIVGACSSGVAAGPSWSIKLTQR
jgi:hypothetical protein